MAIRGTDGPGAVGTWQCATVYCIQQQVFAPGDEELSGECSWASIAEAIRLNALGKTAEEAVDLNRWADLLDGIRMLEGSREP